MRTLLLLQTEVPGWVGPTVAISLATIAVAFVALAAILGPATRRAAQEAKALAQALARLNADLAPALKAMRDMAQQGQEVAAVVKTEVVAVVETSRRLRGRVEVGAERIQERLADLEALYDVVEEEVEDTALDLATFLRRVRSGGSWWSRLRRLLPRRRRR
ncbi:MAG: DUF948 domain-containing protein [Gemmatimonadales bacterium]